MPGWGGLANARVTIFGDVYQLPADMQAAAREVFRAKFATNGGRAQRIASRFLDPIDKPVEKRVEKPFEAHSASPAGPPISSRFNDAALSGAAHGHRLVLLSLSRNVSRNISRNLSRNLSIPAF